MNEQTLQIFERALRQVDAPELIHVQWYETALNLKEMFGIESEEPTKVGLYVWKENSLYFFDTEHPHGLFVGCMAGCNPEPLDL